MADKTYDAINKIAKDSEKDKITLWAGFKEIKGTLIDCDDNKCMTDIITLKQATVKCPVGMNGEVKEKEFKWLNIPSCHIMGFTFECTGQE